MEYQQRGFTVSNQAGRLYVVATPIGNQGDLSDRAREVLGRVDTVAAEDTRHTGRLLARWGIRPRLISLHEHNEDGRLAGLLAQLSKGESVALACDAGTPLISDPGYRLVRGLRSQGIGVEAVPGPSSITAALSVAGLPTDRFVYEGFLPAKPAARWQRLAALAHERRTLVLLESSHRIRASIEAMASAFGASREAAVCRELTKAHETVRLDSLQALSVWLADDTNRRRGEFVMVVAGAEEPSADPVDGETERVLSILADELPTKQAAQLASRITGASRNALYARALASRDDGE